MKSFIHLLEREFWEHRGSFFTTYWVIGAVLVVGSLMGWAFGVNVIANVDGDQFFVSKALQQIDQASDAELRAAVWAGMIGVAQIFSITLFFVTVFFLLGSLYDDRKDRSILFWKSLPVSDTETVLSKLVSATVMAPFTMIGLMAVTHIGLSIVAAMILLWADVNPFKFFWLTIEGPKFWLTQMGTYLVYGLWMLPIWGWLIFCSAFAKSRPFLWAIPLPIGAWFVLRWVELFVPTGLASSLLDWFVTRMTGIVSIFYGVFSELEDAPNAISEIEQLARSPSSWHGAWEKMVDPSMWTGIAIGAALIFAAIWIRRYRDESI